MFQVVPYSVSFEFQIPNLSWFVDLMFGCLLWYDSWGWIHI